MRVLSRPDWAGVFTMRRIRQTAEQIIRKPKIVVEVQGLIQKTQRIYQRWYKPYLGMNANGQPVSD